MFTYNTEVQLHHTDAAGVLFFSHQFTLAHDAYQSFMHHIGLPLNYFIDRAAYFLPIIHAKADYKSPLHVGQKLKIEVAVHHIGHTSFVLHYHLYTEKDQHCGEVETVHVSMDRKNLKKIDLPEELRSKLEFYLSSVD